jgi:hypothetical protein
MSLEIQNKVLIVPLGDYEIGLSSSILHSGADRVYLIKSSNSQYKQLTEEVASRIIKRYGDLIDFKDGGATDFTNIPDVYRAITKLVFLEKKAEKSIDLSSTTNETVIATFNMSQLYNLSLFNFQKESGKRIKFDLPRPPYSGFSDDEILLLGEIYDSMGKDPMKSFVKRKGDKSQRYWIRLLHRLEARRLIDLERSGKMKKVSIRPEGSGTLEGYREAKTILAK